MRRTIQEHDYNFEELTLPIEKLRFWSGNPRIHTEIHGLYTNTETNSELQEEIYLKFKEKSNIRELRQKLVAQGGIAEPLIVRKKTDDDVYEVIEGNRRLSACKMAIELAKKEPDLPKNKEVITRFSNIMCECAPEDISESAIFALTGILHLDGKAEWSPFEKASYMKRREEILIKELSDAGQETDKNAIRAIISKELGDTPREINIQIGNIEMMQEIGEENTTKYSHYDVLNRNTTSREDLQNEEKRERWLETAKTRPQGETALDFRRLVTNACSNKKQLNKFLKGDKSLEKAAEASEDEGSTNNILKKVKKFREYIDHSEKRIISIDPTDPVYKKLTFELRKLKPVIEKIDKKLQEKNGG